MIKPHPESNLQLNIMVLSAEIIKRLKTEKGFVLVENILEAFLQQDKKRTPDLFFNSLTFLFALGLIEQSSFKVRLQAKLVKYKTLFD